MTRRSLARLSDAKLLSELRSLVNKEKQTTLAVLLHLAEVDRRELYLEYGFSSLYDYCVGALGYSRSAAGRRIASARCIRRWPEVYRLLESREVGLSTIGLVAPILTDANKDALLDAIRNKPAVRSRQLWPGTPPRSPSETGSNRSAWQSPIWGKMPKIDVTR
ncbi:MAG: hypothetical protein JSW50_02000 [Candidatus Latescibacterota bacterium]|nr:MAG: hypothetical protein JSW50_02000 [Candidatus Latescibacterota bacterium]